MLPINEIMRTEKLISVVYFMGSFQKPDNKLEATHVSGSGNTVITNFNIIEILSSYVHTNWCKNSSLI